MVQQIDTEQVIRDLNYQNRFLVDECRSLKQELEKLKLDLADATNLLSNRTELAQKRYNPDAFKGAVTLILKYAPLLCLEIKRPFHARELYAYLLKHVPLRENGSFWSQATIDRTCEKLAKDGEILATKALVPKGNGFYYINLEETKK